MNMYGAFGADDGKEAEASTLKLYVSRYYHDKTDRGVVIVAARNKKEACQKIQRLDYRHKLVSQRQVTEYEFNEDFLVISG